MTRVYDELIKRLRSDSKALFSAGWVKTSDLAREAADAIEELLKVASAMHTWIFLHTGDEQAAYDECGLTDEMNAELGYGGQFIVEQPKGEADA